MNEPEKELTAEEAIQAGISAAVISCCNRADGHAEMLGVDPNVLQQICTSELLAGMTQFAAYWEANRDKADPTMIRKSLITIATKLGFELRDPSNVLPKDEPGE